MPDLATHCTHQFLNFIQFLTGSFGTHCFHAMDRDETWYTFRGPKGPISCKISARFGQKPWRALGGNAYPVQSYLRHHFHYVTIIARMHSC